MSRECQVEVQVTELTLGNPIKDNPEHAIWYYKLFEIFKKLVQEDQVPLTNVSIWGYRDEADDVVSLTNGPYFGLLTNDFHAKTTLEAVSCSLKGIEYPKN